MKVRTEYEVIEVLNDGMAKSQGTFEEKGKAVVRCMELAKRKLKVRVVKRIIQTELAWKPRGYDKLTGRDWFSGFYEDVFEKRNILG